MALGLYMDVHVPAAISDALRRRRIDVLTIQEDGTAETDDPELLERATKLGRILFSQDADFLAITADWLAQERNFAGLVYGHQQNTGIGQCIEDLELIATCYSEEALGPRHPERAALLSILGLVLSGPEAVKTQEQALDLHPETLAAMGALAISYFYADRRDEALALREELLKLSRTAYGPKHSISLDAKCSPSRFPTTPPATRRRH